jgi:hypothetical protein
MSGATTIDQSTTISGALTGVNYVIEKNAGTPPGDPVDFSFAGGLLNVVARSKFTVQDGATIQMGSLLNVGVADKFIIGQDGTLELGAGVSAAVLDDIRFEAAAVGGEMIVDQGVNVNLLSGISGFAAGDTIDFSGTAAPVSPNSYTDTFNALSGDTTFTIALDGGGTKVFSLQGDYVGTPFLLSTTGSGGMLFSDAACFAPGTRILTTQGETPVEDLAIGDVAVLADGATSPVTFIGYRLFDLRRHPRPETVSPVRIAAGALADGIPARPLILSPDHALLLDGVLVQTKDLIDGIAITQDLTATTIRYYHVELETHGILLAEGVAAESFLDTGHRGIFDNADEPLLLHPDLMQIRREAESVAPLCHDGEKLASIRAQLHARKLALGFSVIDATATTLIAGGKSLRPIAGDPAFISFDLPEGVTEAVLKSEVFVPAMVYPGSGDRRRLGLAIGEIMVDGQKIAPEDILDPADLHASSAGDPHRWTRGAVHLRVPEAARTITFHVAGGPKRWRNLA